MRQLKALLFAALALVFVAGVGTGAWIGSLSAAPRSSRSVVDRRVKDFQHFFDLSPTQLRQLHEIFHDHQRRLEALPRRTPEQLALEAESRSRIRQILTEEQRREYDRLVPTR